MKNEICRFCGQPVPNSEQVLIAESTGFCVEHKDCHLKSLLEKYKITGRLNHNLQDNPSVKKELDSILSRWLETIPSTLDNVKQRVSWVDGAYEYKVFRLGQDLNVNLQGVTGNVLFRRTASSPWRLAVIINLTHEETLDLIQRFSVWSGHEQRPPSPIGQNP